MNYAIILAAGKSSRFSKTEDKLFVEVKRKPLLYYSIMAYNDHPSVHEIVLVTNKENKKRAQELVKKYRFKKVKNYVLGGKTRQDSLENALSKINLSDHDLCIVHNGANPLPSFEEISESITLAEKKGSCIVGRFLNSTVKEVDKDDSQIIKTHNREKLFAAETPQVVKSKLLKDGLKKAKKEKIKVTDEAMLVEILGEKVSYVESSEENFKVTTRTDLKKVKSLLGDTPENYLVGIGQDSHMFSETEKGLTLAGLYLKEEKKLEANSDGDVILHAIFNAVSQAIGDKSLGFYADPEFEKGETDSKKYLKIILEKMHKKKLKINSLGLMIECKTPKIDPLNSEIKKSLSELLDLSKAKIGITATSGEELTAFGQGVGIQCFAIVSLKNSR